jgi:hypothetical protein
MGGGLFCSGKFRGEVRIFINVGVLHLPFEKADVFPHKILCPECKPSESSKHRNFGSCVLLGHMEKQPDSNLLF